MKIRTNDYILEMARAVINEAMSPGFSYEYLKNMAGPVTRGNYCRRYLGEPVGEGTGRLVFQIDDDKVLKLAKNQAGVAQNRLEAEDNPLKCQLGLFPRVFQGLSDTQGYNFIVSEYVLPAEENDFMECLGVDYTTFDRFIESCANLNKEEEDRQDYLMRPEEIETMVRKHPALVLWYRYIIGVRMTYMDMGMVNFGLALRKTAPAIVMLDSGLDEETFIQYYGRF